MTWCPLDEIIKLQKLVRLRRDAKAMTVQSMGPVLRQAQTIYMQRSMLRTMVLCRAPDGEHYMFHVEDIEDVPEEQLEAVQLFWDLQCESNLVP